MTAPRQTIWTAEPHTLAKHELLRRYLEAWFPILSAHYGGPLIYYDGFSGPGRYVGGEPGSPVVAIEVATKHKAPLRGLVSFVFVEEDPRRAEWLKNVELPKIRLPGNFNVQVIPDRFEPALRRMLDELDHKHIRIAPIFAFVDPFGMSGVPFSLIRRLLQRPSCEAFITFMTRDINRFVNVLPDHVNELIGNPRAAELIEAASDGAAEARRLYSEALRSVAHFVRFFQMRDGHDCPIYDLFFATNDVVGHERMKEAMWAVDGTGTFRFSEGVDPNQLTLLERDPGLEVARLIGRRFAGRSGVASEDVFAHVHETRYVEKHAREALRRMEQPSGVLGVALTASPLKRDGNRRRRGTFAEGTLLAFSEEHADG